MASAPKKARLGIGLLGFALVLWLTEKVVLFVLTEDELSLGSSIGLVYPALGFLVFGFLIYKMAQGRNWARFAYLVLLLVSLLFILAALPAMGVLSSVALSVLLATRGFELAAMVLLFQKEPSRWFQKPALKTDAS